MVALGLSPLGTQLWAVFYSSFQEWLLLCISASVSLCHMFLGLSLFLLRCGFQVRACLVILPAGFLRMWSIQLHFLLSICEATGSWFTVLQWNCIMKLKREHYRPVPVNALSLSRDRDADLVMTKARSDSCSSPLVCTQGCKSCGLCCNSSTLGCCQHVDILFEYSLACLDSVLHVHSVLFHCVIE